MDTSEAYIEMSDCPEIQAFKVYDPMSWYYRKDITGNEVKEGRNLVSVALSIWLPRQDQLQEMLPDFLDPKTTYMDNLPRAIIDDYYKLEKLKSWEQLWLAFVMYQKYNKTWSGKEWKVVRSELCP